jgi:hypothetical protein
MTTVTLTQNDLAQFTGDSIRYRHPLNPKVIYTPGVQYLAEAGGAYWLIDAIASYFGSMEMLKGQASDSRLRSLQFWQLQRDGDQATLTARADSGVAPFITQHIDYTDFPMEDVEIWAGFDGSVWTLYLPSEH